MGHNTENSYSAVCALEQAFQTRPVNTHIFAPFLVARLEQHPKTVERTLEYRVTLHNIGAPQVRAVPLKFTWTATMVPPVPLAAQEEYITEAAAYGLAFAVVSQFTNARLVDVADRGDGFDYSLSERHVRCGIEVSGTQSQDEMVLKDRHRRKVEQLLGNPYGWGGYVVIVGFARREVVMSWHAAKDRRET